MSYLVGIACLTTDAVDSACCPRRCRFKLTVPSATRCSAVRACTGVEDRLRLGSSIHRWPRFLRGHSVDARGSLQPHPTMAR
ncbi:hypothetical protein PRNP1_010343 [Phytophthora ramorum]